MFPTLSQIQQLALEAYLRSLPSNYITEVGGPNFVELHKTLLETLAQLQATTQDNLTNRLFEESNDLNLQDWLPAFRAYQSSSQKQSLFPQTHNFNLLSFLQVNQECTFSHSIDETHILIPGVLSSEEMRSFLEALDYVRPLSREFKVWNFVEDETEQSTATSTISLKIEKQDLTGYHLRAPEKVEGSGGRWDQVRDVFHDPSLDLSIAKLGYSKLVIGDFKSYVDEFTTVEIPSPKTYTTSSGLNGTASVVGGILTDGDQDFSTVSIKETVTIDGREFLISYLCGLDGGYLDRGSSTTSVKLAPLLKLRRRIPKSIETPFAYTLIVEPRGIQLLKDIEVDLSDSYEGDKVTLVDYPVLGVDYQPTHPIVLVDGEEVEVLKTLGPIVTLAEEVDPGATVLAEYKTSIFHTLGVRTSPLRVGYLRTPSFLKPKRIRHSFIATHKDYTDSIKHPRVRVRDKASNSYEINIEDSLVASSPKPSIEAGHIIGKYKIDLEPLHGLLEFNFEIDRLFTGPILSGSINGQEFSLEGVVFEDGRVASTHPLSVDSIKGSYEGSLDLALLDDLGGRYISGFFKAPSTIEFGGVEVVIATAEIRVLKDGVSLDSVSREFTEGYYEITSSEGVLKVHVDRVLVLTVDPIAGEASPSVIVEGVIEDFFFAPTGAATDYTISLYTRSVDKEDFTTWHRPLQGGNVQTLELGVAREVNFRYDSSFGFTINLPALFDTPFEENTFATESTKPSKYWITAENKAPKSTPNHLILHPGTWDNMNLGIKGRTKNRSLNTKRGLAFTSGDLRTDKRIERFTYRVVNHVVHLKQRAIYADRVWRVLETEEYEFDKTNQTLYLEEIESGEVTVLFSAGTPVTEAYLNTVPLDEGAIVLYDGEIPFHKSHREKWVKTLGEETTTFSDSNTQSKYTKLYEYMKEEGVADQLVTLADEVIDW